MAVTIDDILLKGKGPLQQTWADQSTSPTATPKTTEPTQTPSKPVQDDSTGTENISYKAQTSQGAPDNPTNAQVVVQRGVANPQISSDVEHTSPVSVQQTAPEKKKYSYAEMYQMASPYKPPTPEEIEKERKKQKRDSIFAAISDGISALSNLYFTTQYAPNAYDPSKSMSEATRKRYDRLKKERQEYMNGYLRAAQMDDNVGYRDALAQIKEREQKRKEGETNITIALKQADIDYKDAKTDGQAYLNELYRIKGEALAKGLKAQAELTEEKIKTEKAKQRKYDRDASGGGGRGVPSEYPWYDSDGNKHYARSYEAMRQNAIDHGTWNEATQESESEREQTNSSGRIQGKTKTKTTKPAKGHSAKPKKPNPMGKAGNGKKNNPMI